MAAPAAKKRTPKKAAAKAVGSALDDLGEAFDEGMVAMAEAAQRQVVNEDGSINTIEIGRAGRTPNELIDLFTLNGRIYQIASKPSPALMQRFFRDLRKRGREQAAAALLDTLIGDEALDALAESSEVTDEDMAAIYTAVTHVAFGGFAKKGKHASDPS